METMQLKGVWEHTEELHTLKVYMVYDFQEKFIHQWSFCNREIEGQKRQMSNCNLLTVFDVFDRLEIDYIYSLQKDLVLWLFENYKN